MENRTKEESFRMLESMGCFEFGVVTKSSVIRRVFDIEEVTYPAMKNEMARQQLAELGATDYIRNKLLNRGKYFKGGSDSYRVLLPSENAAQILSYMSSADRKLKRGLKLNKNTPVEHKINSQDEIRAIMKAEDIKAKRSA